MSLGIRSAALAAAFSFAAAGTAAAQAPVAIGTLPQGSLGYAIAAATAKVASEKGGLNMRVVGTGGSNVYIPRVAKGEVAFGTSNLFEAKFALTGTENFEGRKNPGVRIAALLMPFTVGIMVGKDSDIRKLTDLKGKPFPVGYARQKLVGIMQDAIFKGVGMTRDDLDGVPVPNFVKGAELLAEGKVAGVLLAPGSGVVKKTHATRPVRFINIPNEPKVSETITSALPGTKLVEVKPNKRLVSIAEPVHLVGYQYAVLAGEPTDEETVYKYVKALYENQKALAEAHGIFNRFDPKKMASVTDVVPFHPGAIRFYKEVGIWQEK